MDLGARRLIVAIATVVIWATITMAGGLIQAGPGTSLNELVTQQLLWGTPAAAAFLLIVAWMMGWHDLGFRKPQIAGMWKLIWLPSLYIIGFFAFGISNASSSLTATMVVAVMLNTLVVGFSEELAFRGVLWGGARKLFSFWPAAILVCLFFGSVHIANGFLTGQFEEAVRQAILASMSGLSFLAIRVRTASLYPAMIIHWLWDFGIFMMGAGKTIAPSGDSSFLAGIAGGLVFVGPVFLFGLYLLRNEAVRTGWKDDGRAAA